MSNEFRIQTLTTDDLECAWQLSIAERWNQTDKDWHFLINNPAYCRSIKITTGEKLVATTTAIIYDNKLAWLGMVLVNTLFRGKGLSKGMLEYMFAQLDRGMSVKLDATPNGREVYQKMGFVDETELWRMTADSIELNNSFDRPYHIRQATADDLEHIISLDELSFGINRAPLISYLYYNATECASVSVAGGEINGFVLGRKGHRFNHIGPLVAKDNTTARQLLLAAASRLRNRLLVDVFVDNAEFVAWLMSAGFVKQRPFIRMYRFNNPIRCSNSHVLVSGPEFG